MPIASAPSALTVPTAGKSYDSGPRQTVVGGVAVWVEVEPEVAEAEEEEGGPGA